MASSRRSACQPCPHQKTERRNGGVLRANPDPEIQHTRSLLLDLQNATENAAKPRPLFVLARPHVTSSATSGGNRWRSSARLVLLCSHMRKSIVLSSERLTSCLTVGLWHSGSWENRVASRNCCTKLLACDGDGNAYRDYNNERRRNIQHSIRRYSQVASSHGLQTTRLVVVDQYIVP